MAKAQVPHEMARMITPEERPIKSRWYQLDNPFSMAVEANEAISTWQTSQIQRIWDYSRYARFYGTARLGFSGTISSRAIHTRNDLVNPLAATFNGIRSVIDTVAAKVAQHKIVPLFDPIDGDWASHKQSLQRQRFIEGVFREQKVYKKGRIAFRDSGVWGDGIVRVGSRFGKITIDRVFPGDLFFNDSESLSNSGQPTEAGYLQLMDRTQAMEMYGHLPGAEEAIIRAPEVKIFVDTSVLDRADLIQINELWRLPPYKGAKGGKHIIATGNSILFEEDYKWVTLPFAIMSYSPRMYGYWSQSVTEQLENLQLQYNELSYSINDAIELAGRFKLFVNSSSNLVVEELDDEIGSVLRGDAAPVSLLWQAVQPEVYERLAKLEAQFFQEIGVSQLNATSMAPAGEESGVARRIQNDIYTERFSLWVQSYQEFFVTLAQLIIQELMDIQESDEESSYRVYAGKGPRLDPIDFKDLGFKMDEEFVISIQPTAELPETPEGKLALANDYVQAGVMSMSEAVVINQLPDMSRWENMQNATRDYGAKILDAMVEKGKYTAPENTDDFVTLKQMAIQHLAFAKDRDVSESRCDLIRNFITECNTLIAQGTPPTPPPTPPLGVPSKPAVSQSLPLATAHPGQG